MEIGFFDHFLAFVYSILILGNALLIKKYLGTLLFPAGIFSLFWFAYTFFPLLFLSLPIETMAIFYILLCIVAFTIPSFFFDWRKAFSVNRTKLSTEEKSKFYSNRFFYKTFYLLQTVVILFLIINLHMQGFSLYDIVFHTLSSANKYMQMRYSNTLTPNIFNQLALILNYTGVVLGGILMLQIKNTKQAVLILIFSFSPSILIMITQAAKGYIFLSMALFYSGILIARINMGDLSLSNTKTNKIFLYLILLLFPALIVSFLSRGLYMYSSDVIIDKLIYYFSSYAFGHLYAFSDWFSFFISQDSLLQYKPASDLYYGFYTFMSTFKLLGSHISVPPGVYDDYLIYDDLLKTNIYTIFRGLILDFGILGSLLFWFMLGFLTHLSFYILLVSKKPVISIAVFTTLFGFFYMSYITSLFMWNSIFASVFVLSIILFLNTHKLKLSKQHTKDYYD